MRKILEQDIRDKLHLLGFELRSEYITTKTKSKIKCVCGSIFESQIGHVIYGKTTSCGCSKQGRKRLDISGDTYNYLTAIKSTNEINNSGSVIWEFECKCGTICNKPVSAVKFGAIKSCGCLDIEISTNRLRELHPLQKGVNHPSYLGDSIDRTKRGILEMLEWRKAVYKRDNYICQKCFTKLGPFDAHHLNSWNMFPSERFILDNGVTLCKTCHVNFHKQYGYGNNTIQQYIEYKGI